MTVWIDSVIGSTQVIVMQGQEYLDHIQASFNTPGTVMGRQTL